MTTFETGAAMKPLWQWDFIDPGPQPDVSVVIPVHGNIAMTMKCLWSLHETQLLNAARVEVIVVDDASPDHSRSTLAQLRGLQVVALDDNVGYLRAANSHGI
jgi:glycosyltransferase involved in cell wall biosynthesis